MGLSDAQWSFIEPLVLIPPHQPDRRDRYWRDPRDVMNGALWIFCAGALWKDLPERYPTHQTCRRCFQQRFRDGAIERVLHGLAEDLYERGKLDIPETFSHGTFAGARKGGRTPGSEPE